MKEKFLIELALFTLRYVADKLLKKYPQKSARFYYDKELLLNKAEKLFDGVSESWNRR